MKKFTVNCIDIWTEGNTNPFRLDCIAYKNGDVRWWIHEEYFDSNVSTYDHIDFVGTYAECLDVMNKYLEFKVKE